VGRLSYEIRDPKTKSEPKKVHARHLKPFVTPLIDKNIHPSIESVQQEERGAEAALTQAPVVAQQVASDGNKAEARRRETIGEHTRWFCGGKAKTREGDRLQG